MTPWTCPIDGGRMRYADGRCRSCVRRKQRLYNRRLYARARDMIIKALGGKCAVCGLRDRRVLHIDHVKGGGNVLRRKMHGTRYYPAILAELHKGKFQLLCANHNAIKKSKRREKTRRLK